jgi:hypothetical protein
VSTAFDVTKSHIQAYPPTFNHLVTVSFPAGVSVASHGPAAHILSAACVSAACEPSNLPLMLCLGLIDRGDAAWDPVQADLARNQRRKVQFNKVFNTFFIVASPLSAVATAALCFLCFAMTCWVATAERSLNSMFGSSNCGMSGFRDAAYTSSCMQGAAGPGAVDAVPAQQRLGCVPHDQGLVGVLLETKASRRTCTCRVQTTWRGAAAPSLQDSKSYDSVAIAVALFA